MKIAVTGASGFIGQSVCRALLAERDITVLGLTRGGREHLPELPGRQWLVTDYTKESLGEILQGVDGVIHLAAIRGTTGLISDYHPNETMLEQLLLAMGEAKVPQLVFASSIAVYSDVEQIPWRETMPLTPKTLYGISKAACEHLCAYYAKQQGFACTVFRIAQVLGTGEKRRGIMNVFMDLAAEGQPLKVLGKSSAKRQYIYVEDLARAMARAVRRPEGFRILNIGMEEACTNLEIAQTVNRVFSNPTEIQYDDSFPEIIEPSCMEIGCLRETLGLTPRPMEEALEDIHSHLFRVESRPQYV